MCKIINDECSGQKSGDGGNNITAELAMLMPQPKRVDIHETAVKNTRDGIKMPENWNRLRSHMNGISGMVNIEQNSYLKKNDEYVISSRNGVINISAGTERAAYYACYTLKQLKCFHDGHFVGDIHDWADIEKRIIMIDLKRISWNFDYLLGLIKRFSELKINYVLIEYEDKFPFETIPGIAVESALSKEQIRQLNDVAHEYFIEIIPLVQSLAHWEYVLRHERYAGLRENPLLFSQGCPLNPGTFELFTKMASEIIAAHPYSKMLHVGADEPFLLGTCNKCKKNALEHGFNSLYMDYILKVLNWVIDKNMIPFCWADIVRKYDDGLHQLPAAAVLCDWDYGSTQTRCERIILNREGKSRISYDDFLSLTEKTQKRFEAYLKPDKKSKKFYSFPFLPFLKQHTECKVIGAGNINSVDNILAHAEAAIEHNTNGLLATYWAAANSLRQPYTIYETRMPGVIMTAAACWNFDYEKNNRKNFFKRCAGFVLPGNVSPLCLELLNNTQNMLASEIEDHFAGIKPISCSNKDICTTIANKMIFEQTAFSSKWLAKPLFKSNDYKILDLSNIANSRFKYVAGQASWPNKNADLSNFPRGKKCIGGIIYEFKSDGNKTPPSLIMVGAGPDGVLFPNRITIPVKKKTAAISFVHAIVENLGNSETLGRYIFKYNDGTEQQVPLFNHKNIGPWWRIMNCSQADIAWAGENPAISFGKVGMLSWTYVTGKSDVELLSVDLVCNSLTTIALAAVTIINPSEGNVMPENIILEMNAIYKRLCRLQQNLKVLLPEYIGLDSVDEIIKLAFNNSFSRLKRLEELFNLKDNRGVALETDESFLPISPHRLKGRIDDSFSCHKMADEKLKREGGNIPYARQVAEILP